MLIGGSPTTLMRLSDAGVEAIDLARSGAEAAGVEAPTGDGVVRLLARLEQRGMLIASPPPLGPAAVRTLLGDLTVVVPVRDDPDGLARLLQSLAEAARALGVERIPNGGRCLVVDDGSADEARVAGVARRWGADVIRRAHGGGPGAARTTGLQAVTTPLVAFLDADVEVTPGWLAAVGAHFAGPTGALTREGPAVVAPRVVAHDTRADRSPPAVVGDYEQRHSPLDLGVVGGPIAAGTRLAYAPSAAWVARADAIRSVGGFDDELRYGEDVDLIWRLAGAGRTARFEPRSVVFHRVRPTVMAWAEQRFRYGTSAAPLAVRHPGALAPVAVSPWSLAAWAAAALGHPSLGAGLAAGSTAALARRLHVAEPGAEALRLAGRGHALAGPQLARGMIRPWWPVTTALALRSGRARRLAVTGLLACVAHRWSRPNRTGRGIGGERGGRWIAVRAAVAGAGLAVADDVAYSAGVWWGLASEVRRRPATARDAAGSLLPRLGGIGGPGERVAERLRSATKRGERA